MNCKLFLDAYGGFLDFKFLAKPSRPKALHVDGCSTVQKTQMSAQVFVVSYHI
jgi:hypothetical protein